MSKQKKVSRKEQRRLEKARQQRMNMIRNFGIPGIIILGIIIFAIVRISNQAEVDGVTTVSAAIANQHDTAVEYPFEDYPLPPLGGPHNPSWQNCGIYDTPVLAQFAVHSMEHGAIWIAYNPELPAADREQLEDIARGDNYLLLAPYPNLEAPIVLSAWDRQVAADSASDDQVGEFIRAYRRARGPERSATCTNGVGSPVG